MLQPHQQRVIAEYDDLSQRLVSLRSFISDDTIFSTLPDEDKDLLIQQRCLMAELQSVLAKRIARFNQ